MSGVSELEGLFKKRYGPEVVRAVPNAHKLSKMLPFVAKSKREGDDYNVPVLLKREHGHTFNLDGSAFTLNGAVSDQSKNANLKGAEYVLQVELSYGAMQKAAAKGERAFENATKYKVRAALESASFAREYMLLYGGGTAVTNAAVDVQGLGEVETGNASATSGTFVVSAKTWSLGLWAGLEGAQLDMYTAAGALDTGFSATEYLQVDSINPDTRTISWSSVNGGSLTVTAASYAYFRGAATKEMNGACRVASTTSGTINGISATTYQLWQGSTKAIGGALTFTKVMDALRRPAALGCNSTLRAFVSTNAWQDINNDQAALRRFVNKEGGKVTQGAERLCYYGQTGKLEIEPHPFMKQGFGLILPVDKAKCMRVGATDVTFEMPDGKGQIFRQLDTKAGTEMRCYFNQSYFTPCPAYTVLLTGITSTGDY